MTHEAVFVLVAKEEAKNSFEARRLVALTIENEIRMFYSPPYPRVGGDFSGLLSDLCGEKAIVPFYNEELRDSVRKYFSKLVPELKSLIEKQENKRALVKVSEIKKLVPEIKKYNDADLLDALRLELSPIGLDVNLEWTRKEEIVYTFTKLYKPFVVTSDLRENGRDASLEFGYEDDAMLINECLYREVIDKRQGRIMYIEDIGKDTMDLAAKGGLKEIRPEDVIGKKWIVLVDHVD